MSCTRGCCATNREHWLSVVVAPSATPSRDRGAGETAAKESRWDRDMAAYRRLRKDGLQPPGIDGAARAERHAETKAEVESGTVLTTAKQRAQLKELTGDSD